MIGEIRGNRRCIKDIVDQNGKDIQMVMVTEELAELIQAVCKYKRQIHNKATELRIREAHDHIIEEMADVYVVLDQLKYICDIDDYEIQAIYDQKIIRTLSRMTTMVKEDYHNG